MFGLRLARSIRKRVRTLGASKWARLFVRRHTTFGAHPPITMSERRNTEAGGGEGIWSVLDFTSSEVSYLSSLQGSTSADFSTDQTLNNISSRSTGAAVQRHSC